jgi:alpha-beta hydrolase superfamily lysophospholipase
VISQRQQIIQLKDSENSLDFLKERIGLEEREHKKISIVGHSLGGYIAAEVGYRK